MELKSKAHDKPEADIEIETPDSDDTTKDSKDTIIERRISDSFGTEVPYKFLVLDSTDKWPVAGNFSSHYDMPVLGSNSSIRFNLTGISLKEWESIEADNVIPAQQEGQDDKEYESERDSVVLKKEVAIFEKAIGQSIPGKKAEEKIDWLKQRNPGEIEALFRYIQNDLCNMRNGSMIDSYNLALEHGKANEKEIRDFSNFEDWQTATTSQYTFRMQRPYEDYIIEVPLRGLSQELKKDIDAQTKDPEPPKMPHRDPKTNRFDPMDMRPNFSDPAWLRSSRAVNQKRTAMYMDACLMFDIPGSNWQEKYNWLADRLTGDVINIKNFIENDLVGFRSRYDFF